MVVPTKKLSKSKYKKRRFQKANLKPLALQKCSNCQALILSHRICPDCGFYKGKFVISLKKNKKKTKEN
ncbi:MAG: 50S ribosomal protein L32 [Candidatus Parcubacteria bacterium]|nr:MAG: 50S ribosomal protein L32 [Candidatus Parcubacteria bacterium]